MYYITNQLFKALEVTVITPVIWVYFQKRYKFTNENYAINKAINFKLIFNTVILTKSYTSDIVIRWLFQELRMSQAKKYSLLELLLELSVFMR